MTTWTVPDFADEQRCVTLSLTRVDTISIPGLEVPVWQVAKDPRKLSSSEMSFYKGRFVRYIDLPAKMHESFARWQNGAQQPFADAAYDYDLRRFLAYFLSGHFPG